MKNIKYFLIALIVLATSCASNYGAQFDIEYEVTPSLKNSKSIDVTFKYNTDSNGDLVLNYLNSSMGDNAIFNCIKSLKVDLTDAKITFVKDSDLIKIKSLPNTKIKISYSIEQDFNGPLYNKHRYRPIISESYFHILGSRLFMVPQNVFVSETSKVKIGINWTEFKEDQIFHSSFGYDKNQSLILTEEDFYSTFFIGGDFRRREFLYKNKPVYFVTRGDWRNFKDEDVFKILKETISFQNDFWKDTIQNSFSVSLLPTEETNRYSIGGSGFSNSFISFASNNQFTGLKSIAWLYNHELLHKWLSRTIINENEVAQYWFSEGFTDYYAHKLLLKNDKITLNDFIKTINTTISEHHKDKINTIPNSQLTFDNYWGNYLKYQKLPYRRGLLYAFLLDSQIKIKHDFRQSLDDLMLDLLAMAKADSSMRLNNEVFKKMLLKYLDKNSIKEFEKYILKGGLIDFKEPLVRGLEVKSDNSIPQFIVSSSASKEQLKKKLKS